MALAEYPRHEASRAYLPGDCLISVLPLNIFHGQSKTDDPGKNAKRVTQGAIAFLIYAGLMFSLCRLDNKNVCPVNALPQSQQVSKCAEERQMLVVAFVGFLSAMLGLNTYNPNLTYRKKEARELELQQKNNFEEEHPRDEHGRFTKREDD